MKTRLKFSKGGVLRYIGHLDLMRYFQKAMRRAGIPIAYSEGFHPHQKMSFAMPLGVGMTSEGEYMDVELDDSLLEHETIVNTDGSEDIRYKYDFAAAIDSLNSTMAEGVAVLDFAPLSDERQKAMAQVAAAEYYLYFKNNTLTTYDELMNAKSSRFDNASSMVVEKKTKKSTRQMDMAGHIYSFEILSIDEAIHEHLTAFLPDYENNGFLLGVGDPVIRIKLSNGSEENIKPELFLSYLLDKDIDEVSPQVGTHRVDLLMKADSGEFVSLMDSKNR